MVTSTLPLFSRVSVKEKEQYECFFRETDPTNIQYYAFGKSLTNLVEQAEKVIAVIERCNPIWDTYNGSMTDQTTARAARQWQLDRISEVKQRLAQAIPYKISYYEHHWTGIITKFILKCFCLWNNGFTNSINKAEEFLLFWDSRVPLFKCNGTYAPRYFFPLTPVSWVQDHLDTTRFYNYTPLRKIEFTGTTGLHSKTILPPGFERV